MSVAWRVRRKCQRTLAHKGSGSAFIASVLVLGSLVCGRVSILRATPCTTGTIGLDLSRANDYVSVAFCRTVGQVFKAPQGQVRAISVWRTPLPPVNNAPKHLYILAADSLGTPDPSRVIQDGPVINPTGSINGQPELMRFEIDPPVQLPSAGYYFFGIKEDTGFVHFDLMDNTLNDYPDGHVWKVGPTADCKLGGLTSSNPDLDLVFSVEYCDSETQTQSATWGRLKQLYH
jgi:hypothetical protein